jgi:hypothetical protein
VKENKLFYIGKFGETVPSETEMIKEAEMFSTGVHRGQEYTEEDLKTLVENFSEADQVPIQLDHSESARDTVGFLKEVFSKGGKLMGKVHIIDEYAKERIDKGLMNKLSVSFYLKHTEEGFRPHKLREVSLVAFPQVKGARLFSENGYVSDYEEGGENMSQFDLEKFKEEQRKAIELEVHAEFDALKAKADKFEETQKALKLAEVNTKVEKFQADNKVVPAQAEALVKLLASFSEEQSTLFDAFMAENKVADFSEQGEVEGAGGEEKDTRTQEQKDFDSFYEEYTQKFGKSL